MSSNANPQVEQSLDFSKIPLADAVQILQALALVQIDRLLPDVPTVHRGRASAPPPERKTQVVNHSKPIDVAIFAKSKSHHFQARRKVYGDSHVIMQYGWFLFERLFRFFGWEWRFSYLFSIQQFMAKKISRTILRARFFDQWEGRAGQVSMGEIPEDLWPLLQEMAWGDLDFQKTVAIKVQNYIHQRILVEPGELLTIHFHHNTYSLLVAWAAANITQAKQRKNTAQSAAMKRQKPGLQRLQEFGFDMSQLTGTRWASLWDQWILYQANKRWSAAVLPNEVAQIIKTLPIFDIYILDDPIAIGDPTDHRSDISLRDWNIEHPSWFEALIKGS